MTFIKRLFTRYTPPSKDKLIANWFVQGANGWQGNRWL